MHCGDWLEIAIGFKCLGYLITIDRGISEKITSRNAKARAASVKLRHLWSYHDILLPLNKKVYNATVRSVLYSCPTNLCIWSPMSPKWCWSQSGTLGDQWQGSSSWCWVQTVVLWLRCFGHIFVMPVHRLPRRVAYTLAGRGWRKQYGRGLLLIRSFEKYGLELKSGHECCSPLKEK